MQQGYRSRGSGQQQKLRFPCFSRPHSFVYSEHQPKECAGSRKEKERKETKKNKKKVKERRLVRYRAERARAKGRRLPQSRSNAKQTLPQRLPLAGRGVGGFVVNCWSILSGTPGLTGTCGCHPGLRQYAAAAEFYCLGLQHSEMDMLVIASDVWGKSIPCYVRKHPKQPSVGSRRVQGAGV